MGWFAHYDLLPPAFMSIGLVLSLVGWLSGIGWLSFAIGPAILLATAAYWLKDIIFYNFIRCLKCNEKLNIYKNGSRIPTDIAWGYLQNNRGCRYCGWTPESQA